MRQAVSLEGMLTTSSLSWFAGISYIYLKIESNVVCGECAKFVIEVDKILFNVSVGIGIFLLAAFYTGLLIIFCLGQLFAPQMMR